MLIGNPNNNHAFIAGEVVGIQDEREKDNYLMVRVKHNVYNAATRTSQDVFTAIYIRNIEADIQSGRPAIPFADRARNKALKSGSIVGVYCVVSNDFKTAKGYGLMFDGVTSFKGVNRNDEPTNFSIVMGAVKRLTQKVDGYGNTFVSAHVYIGKYFVRDAQGNVVCDGYGNPLYQYRYVDINGRNNTGNRFLQVLQPVRNEEGKLVEKNVVFLCGGQPYQYTSSADNSTHEIYTALQFQILGLVKKSH